MIVNVNQFKNMFSTRKCVSEIENLNKNVCKKKEEQSMFSCGLLQSHGSGSAQSFSVSDTDISSQDPGIRICNRKVISPNKIFLSVMMVFGLPTCCFNVWLSPASGRSHSAPPRGRTKRVNILHVFPIPDHCKSLFALLTRQKQGNICLQRALKMQRNTRTSHTCESH